MKKWTIIWIMLLAFSITVNGQSRNERRAAGYVIDNYEVTCMGTGMDGTQLIKVWGFGKKPEDAIHQARKNAVHAVIFKGILGGQPGCMQRPLVNKPGAEVQHADYFNNFFSNGGSYLRFVSQAGDGSVDRIKIDKRTFKVGVVVSVMHAQLRRELEAAGIIPKLGQGF
ncbi:MAG TPA: hypothetical protein DCY35_04860 [Prolixibacteraceae bacterium]|nr:hypothetical protein [Prolixibacteraceae bacterium]